MINYKGLFYKEESKKRYYEGGAHFKYIDLFRALEKLKLKKEEEEESEKNTHSRNRSIDYYQEKDKFRSNKQRKNLFTLENDFDSPKKELKNNIDIIDHLLSLDRNSIHKKRKIKLKEINLDDKQKGIPLFQENNRYNYNEVRARNNSLDLNNLNDKNKRMNKILLTEESYNNKIDKNIFNLKLAKSINPKSQKNSSLDSLPKIESPYFNHLSKKNLFENISNSYLDTNITNKKNKSTDPKSKLENEINKNLFLPEFNVLARNKKLPNINEKIMSTINYDNSNNILNKNRLIFSVKRFHNNKNEEYSLNKDDNNINKYDNENENILRNIHLKKNNYKILKLGKIENEENDDAKIKISHNHKTKKSHRKSSKRKNIEEEE